MSYKDLDPSFNIQRLAPTERGGRVHAKVRNSLPEAIGQVIIETSARETLGIADVGRGDQTARLIVMSDGLGRSGCPVYTPAIIVIPESAFDTL